MRGKNLAIFENLSHFLKRQKMSSEEEVGPSPDYVFAHYALRQAALHDPLRFLTILAMPQAEQFIASVMKNVAEQCGRPTTFNAADIQIHRVRINGFPSAIIQLPEPKEMAEAFMVALVLPMDKSGNPPPGHESLQGRYFTLEKGFSFSGEPQTVLAEWTAKGARANYGNGPLATVAEFINALGVHVKA